MQTLEKIQGGLMGLAVGDALGATTEFMSAEEIKKTYGKVTDMLGGGWLHLKVGETTDDTAMTLAVARGIIESPEDPIEAIGNQFLKWAATNPPDIGLTTNYVLGLVKPGSSEQDWFKAAKSAHNTLKKSAGNGSLMRCLPVALFYSDGIKMDTTTILQSKMTHYDSLAYDACLIYNRIAYQILNHNSDMKDTIKKQVLGTRYEHVLTSDPKSVPDGYVVHTFEWVLRSLLTTNSYIDAVLKLVNMGEDADTTAAIAGGLAGLHYGYNAIPLGFVNKILLKEEILDVAQKIYDKSKYGRIIQE